MDRAKFDISEFEVIGENPSIMPGIIPGMPIFKRPITPKENFDLLLSGKTPYWIPHASFLSDEVHTFRPRFLPDNYATRMIFDGEPSAEYEGSKAKGWFDLEWVYEDEIAGAMVFPGNSKVTDIDDWENQVPFPSLDSIDWEVESARYTDYFKTVNYKQTGIMCGLWERLIALMDVDGAAIAMVDDDQKPGVHRLFDRLCILYDDLIGRFSHYFDLDSFLLHDDWGTQHSTFFSEETCREMLLPYHKRIADSCHKHGLTYELHSCGKVEPLIPVMIDAGVDLWCGQTMNNFDEIAHKYSDAPMAFGVPLPQMDFETSPEENRALAKAFVDRYDGCKIALMFDDQDGIGAWEQATPEFIDDVYEFSRIKYQDAK